MSMETKMAKSVSHIRDVIDDLLEDAFSAQVSTKKHFLKGNYLREGTSRQNKTKI